MATKKRPGKKSSPKRPAKRPASKRPASKRSTSKPPATSRTKARNDLDERVAQIQRVIDLMVESGAVEVELESGGSRLRVRLKEDAPIPTIIAQPGIPPAVHVPPSVAPSGAPLAAEEDEAEGEVFTSPMVGTLFQAPSPEAEPFVQVGDRVGPDTTLCIIEAMKVMNEIKAEMEGQITAILVENGEPVEFGQPLFRVKP